MTEGLPLGFLSSPGMGEILFILVVVLILFGPKKLPEIARTVGRIMAEMRRASQDFQDQILRLDQPPPSPPGSRRGPAPTPTQPPPRLMDAEARIVPEPGAETPAPSEPPAQAKPDGEEDRHDLAG